MMKIIGFVVLIAVTFQLAYAGPEEMAKIVAECKAAEKISDADVMNYKNKVKPLTKEMKCMSACISEKMGLINNNQINKDGFLKLGKSMPNSNEKVMQSITEIVEECKGVQDADRCEYGAKLMDCMMEGGAKRGMTNVFM